MDRLFVHYQCRLVGTLELSAAGEWAFAYVPEWRQSSEGFPVSLSLPFGGALSGASAHSFFPHLDRNLAMKIGDEEDPTILLRRHWEQLAEETGLKPSFVLDTVRELAERLPGAVVRARSHFKEAYRESPALELVIPKVTRQVRRLLKQLDS